jgi:hypothetical protein
MSKPNPMTAGLRAKLRQMIKDTGRNICQDEIIKGKNIQLLSIKNGDFVVSIVHEPDKRYADIVFNYTFSPQEIERMEELFKETSLKVHTQLLIKQIIVDKSQFHEVTYSENDKIISRILVKRRIYPLDDFTLNDFEQCFQDILNTAYRLADCLILAVPLGTSDIEAKAHLDDEDLNRMFI